MSSPTRATDTYDFSLVLGGPLYQLWRRLFLSGPALELLARRMIGIPTIAWLPLLVLSTWEGYAFRGVAVPFVYDFAVHARFLVAVPILLLAEILVHERIQLLVQQFVTTGIVRSETLPGFQAAIRSAMRLRNSLLIEIGLAVFAFGFGWAVWRGDTGLAASSWFGTVQDGTRQITTVAGWWYLHISIPMFQFLLYRWLFRLFVWFVFLRRVARLPLHLTPTHPDRAGGLGFVGAGAHAFVPVILAQSIVLSAVIGSRIVFHGKPLLAFQYEIVAFLVVQLLFVLGPPCVFAKTLLELKRRGRREYGVLAAHYTSEFHDKWIKGGAPPGEPLLGSSDIQSLADLANSYSVIGEMRPVPFSRDTIMQVVGAVAIPLLPLALSIVPADQILKQLFSLLL